MIPNTFALFLSADRCLLQVLTTNEQYTQPKFKKKYKREKKNPFKIIVKLSNS